jgi:prephenate dehydrogenase
MPQTYETIAIVGVGLIGASIGLAVRERKLAGTIVGVGRTKKTLDAAKTLGAIDRATMELAEGVKQAELTIVCTPVERIAEQVRAAAAAAPRGALITDAGSTKEGIVAALADPLPNDAVFIGSHPLAGSEKTGPEAARADLFVGRVVVITPRPSDDAKKVAAVRAFWESLGAKVVEMSAAEHDAAVAVTSHVPHLVASALAASTPAELTNLVAGGWLDTTRIASGDAELWRQILLANRDHSLQALANFEKVLAQLRDALSTRDGDALARILEAGKKIRDTVGS